VSGRKDESKKEVQWRWKHEGRGGGKLLGKLIKEGKILGILPLLFLWGLPSDTFFVGTRTQILLQGGRNRKGVQFSIEGYRVPDGM